MRKGLGKGKGSGWKNLARDDSRRHGMSAKGIKSAQRLPSSIRNKYVDVQRGYAWSEYEKANKILKADGSSTKDVKRDALGRVLLYNKTKDGYEYDDRFPKDTDSDGVFDHQDCQPLNPDAQDSAEEIIRKEYGTSKNFITPNKIKVGKIKDNIAYELSSGSGFEPGTTVYGVSVVLLDKEGNTHRDIGLSESFQSKAKAERYIKKLKDDPTLFRLGSTHFYFKPQDDGKSKKEVISGFLNKIFKSKKSMKESNLTPYPIAEGESVVEIETIIEGVKVVPADKVLSIQMADIERFKA